MYNTFILIHLPYKFRKKILIELSSWIYCNLQIRKFNRLWANINCFIYWTM